jgi:hypothetical protein
MIVVTQSATRKPAQILAEKAKEKKSNHIFVKTNEKKTCLKDDTVREMKQKKHVQTSEANVKKT